MRSDTREPAPKTTTSPRDAKVGVAILASIFVLAHVAYGGQEVSPYPGQDAPVIATSWRVQLELRGADDPRLRQFVDQFRLSELAPLSGNRCTGGVVDPQT